MTEWSPLSRSQGTSAYWLDCKLAACRYFVITWSCSTGYTPHSAAWNPIFRPDFDSNKDIPGLSGKVILITGGTAGIGAQTVLTLVAHAPAHIFFTGRSATSADQVISEAKEKFPDAPVTFIKLDLASFSSIQEGVKKFLTLTDKLDTLICNAGIMALPPGLTKDGYEIQFGTNHLGHALLIKLLLPTLLSTVSQPNSDVRIISLSSGAASMHPTGGILFRDLKTTQDNFYLFGPWQRYGQSKLANVLYASELAKHYGGRGILAVSIHPGVFNTGLIRNLGWENKWFIYLGHAGPPKDEKKEGEGSWNSCWAATSPREKIKNGGFYFPVGKEGVYRREMRNEFLAGELWEWTQKELEGWN